MGKKIAASLYIKEQKAVKDQKSPDIIKHDPVELARYYNDNGADELFVFDLSENDREHDAFIGLLKDITRAVEIPVFAGGNVKRAEDIKKLLYAGAGKALLNFEKESNMALAEEVSKRFGRDKIGVFAASHDTVQKHCESIRTYASRLLTREQPDGLLDDGFDSITVLTDTIDLGAMIKLLMTDCVESLGGSLINSPDTSLFAIKSACKKAGIPVAVLESRVSWEMLKLNQDKMVPVIVQDYLTDEVLMLAYMNDEAFEHTIATGKMTYWSRSRNELWIKGETSGHYQYVKSLTLDCDMDTLLAKVSQRGAACHTGSRSCFFNPVAESGSQKANPRKVLEDVYSVIRDRKENPKEGSYTNYLFDKGIDKILKKVGEEATEIVIAAKNPDPEEIKYELSDFLYHAMVLMVEKGVSWEDITDELAQR